MIEQSPKNNPESQETAQVERMRMVAEIIESGEVFHFPGIRPEVYEQIKEEQAEYPGYTTPIDELLLRFQNEGMKLIAGRDVYSRDILVLPQGSDDVVSDALPFKNVSVAGDIDSRLQELVHEPLKILSLEAAFVERRAQLVESKGYEVLGNNAKWLTLSKDGFEIKLKQYSEPDEFGYEGGKIIAIEVRSKSAPAGDPIHWEQGMISGELLEESEAGEIFHELIDLLN